MRLVLTVWFSSILHWMPAAGKNEVRPTFHPPLAGDAVSPTCVNFTYGSWPRREFYSPGYPGNYPNKTECINLLIAPKHYRIQIDFRDEFKIEPSPECKYDYVEFRDGPFGYSPLIGRYCGNKHPRMMESSSRFLWVHFASDDSIEYNGFRVVYDFYKPTDSNSSVSSVCNIEVDISKHEGYISQDDIKQIMSDSVYLPPKPLDCTWAFYLPVDHRVTLKFEHLMTTMGSCEDSFLEIYEDSTAITDRKKKLCGSMPSFYKSDSHHAYIRLHGKRSDNMPKFSAFFTVFTPGPCNASLFDCGDNTCINKSLECNGNDNCNFKWDEQSSSCETSTVALPTREPVIMEYHTVVIGIVGGAIITIILMAIVITCVQKKREDSRQRHALHQEERHAMEIEMTNLLNRSPVHGGRFAAPVNGPTNHVSAAHLSTGNHISPPQPRERTLEGRHNGHMEGRHNGHTEGVNGSRQTQINGDECDFAEQNGGHPSYKNYLDVRGDVLYRGDGAKTAPTVVTIEKQPPPGQKLSLRKDIEATGASNRDRTPSPRPDVVQEEKYSYPEAGNTVGAYPGTLHGPTNPARRSRVEQQDSEETLARREKGDVWKPLAAPEAHSISYYPSAVYGPTPSRSEQYGTEYPQPVETAIDDCDDNVEYADGRTALSYAPYQSLPPPPDTTGRHDQAASRDEDIQNRRGKVPPVPPQRHTPELPRQHSATALPAQYSPPTAHSRNPASKQRESNIQNVFKGRSPEKTPSMFYSRPNMQRPERSTQYKHHPV